MPVIQIIGIAFATLLGLFAFWGLGSFMLIDADWRDAKPLSPARIAKSTLAGFGLIAAFCVVGAFIVFTVTAASGGFN